MYLGTFDLDDHVNIPAVTHRFSSGAAYAPTAISYSIYEEGNATGLDENVDMTPASPFDAQTGFYLARRQLTAAAGFERGKTYVVLVKATVDGVAAIEAHVFQIRPVVEDAVWDAVRADHVAAGSFGEVGTTDDLVSAVFARAFSAAYGSLTFDELVKLIAAALLGKLSGAGTATETIRNLADTGDAIVATVDASGNRTAVTRTP